jgi:hypothetical protein
MVHDMVDVVDVVEEVLDQAFGLFVARYVDASCLPALVGDVPRTVGDGQDAFNLEEDVCGFGGNLRGESKSMLEVEPDLPRRTRSSTPAGGARQR